MQKVKTWVIDFLKKKFLFKYEVIKLQIKILIVLFIGILLVTPYENYFMRYSMKYLGEWLWYPLTLIEFGFLIFIGYLAFKWFMASKVLTPVVEPVVEVKQEGE